MAAAVVDKIPEPAGPEVPIVDEEVGGATTVYQTTGLKSWSGYPPWKAAWTLRAFPPHPLGMGNERSQGPGGFPMKRPGLTSQVRGLDYGSRPPGGEGGF